VDRILSLRDAMSVRSRAAPSGVGSAVVAAMFMRVSDAQRRATALDDLLSPLGDVTGGRLMKAATPSCDAP